MDALAARIAQFENMAQADPTNEMAHFSLAGAYEKAGRHAEAADRYLRCIQLVPDMSKAYQLAGQALVNAGQGDRARSVLAQGYIIAAQKGDLMPKKAMGDLLKGLGEPLPEVDESPRGSAVGPGAGAGADAPAHSGPVPEGMIVCRKTGRLATKMKRPPFRGPVGAWIAAHIGQETFDLWIRQGTKVINELRLDLSRDKDQEAYDAHMHEFLGLDEALLSELRAAR